MKHCATLGCDELVEAGRCKTHARQNERAKRETPSERGYDALWARFRLLYLARHPLCADCAAVNRATPAREVHHIHKLRDGGPRLDASNCMALCSRCHATRTRRGE